METREYNQLKSIILNEVKYKDEYQREFINKGIFRNNVEAGIYLDGYLDAFNFVLKNYPGLYKAEPGKENDNPYDFMEDFNKIIDTYNMQAMSESGTKFKKGDIIKVTDPNHPDLDIGAYYLVIKSVCITNRHGEQWDRLIYFTNMNTNIAKRYLDDPVYFDINEDGKTINACIDYQTIYNGYLNHNEQNVRVIDKFSDDVVDKLCKLNKDYDAKMREKYSSIK